jgi:hypothetical protein
VTLPKLERRNALRLLRPTARPFRLKSDGADNAAGVSMLMLPKELVGQQPDATFAS